MLTSSNSKTGPPPDDMGTRSIQFKLKSPPETSSRNRYISNWLTDTSPTQWVSQFCQPPVLPTSNPPNGCPPNARENAPQSVSEATRPSTSKVPAAYNTTYASHSAARRHTPLKQ